MLLEFPKRECETNEIGYFERIFCFVAGLEILGAEMLKEDSPFLK